MKRKNMIRRNLSQTIRTSLGRFIAIVAIVALGAGIFCGLKVTKVDMVATVQRYADEQNMFDLRVANTYGWTDRQVEALSQVEGIADAEGAIGLDVLMRIGSSDDHAYKLLSIPEQVNRVSLSAGRMPQSADECLADSFYYDESILGQTFTVSPDNDEDTLENLACGEYTVVGLTGTPLYLNMQRGSTSIGNGSISAYLYILPEGFALDTYTEINLTLEGDYRVYTDQYDDAMDDMAEYLEDYCEPLAQQRFDEILAEPLQEIADAEAEIRDAEAELADGERELADGWAEYYDGLAEYESSKADALQQLADGERELQNAQWELDDNRQLLADGQQQIAEAEATLADGQAEIDAGWIELANQRESADAQMESARQELDSNKAQAEDGLSQAVDGLAQIEDGLAQIQEAIPQLEDGIAQIDDGLVQLDEGIAQLDALIAQLEALPGSDILNPILEELKTQRDIYAAQRQELQASREEYAAQLEALRVQEAELIAQRESLLETKATLEDALVAIDDGYAQLAEAQALAEAEFTAAADQLTDAQNQIDDGHRQLEEKKAELSDGLRQLEDGQATLNSAWGEYYDGKETALRELADAEQTLREAEQELTDGEADLQDGKTELADARTQLQEAKDELNDLEEPTVYALTRNTNLGFVVFESDSDIVDGVAAIFPVFFLAVAALVCITTMSRMVDEERTQIGILKALGYSSRAIMSKYLGYSGSAALLGCLLGIAMGCTLFPMIIWYAYCIMYGFSDQLTLSYDIGTIVFILVSYLGLMLAVTCYCCRRELKEAPAELIRPKAPAAGKKILLERLPFWKNLSFLNKVAIRNIFRYRQRLAMMLLGIGGCTALLVTGFGLNDSISNIVQMQYEDIIQYDIGVTFSDPMTEDDQADFCREFDGRCQQILFCYQGGIDVECDAGVKNVNFLVTDQSLEGYFDLHNGDEAIAMPGQDEVLVSIGTAEALGIQVGDSITLRDSDLREMTVSVSGIFENYVYNYAILSGDTMRSQWGQEPELTTAFVVQAPSQEVHQLGADMAGFDNVLTITINQDSADTVGNMMEALDAVILLIVICAGLLAATVLYNLTNINIKERLREIATIKVLGFHAGETASYVFKENLALTVMGTLLGLGAGKLLHAVVMSYVRIDMVWFDNRILWPSYLFAAVLTLLSAIIVDFIMFFQLERINMAEALKSVE